MYKRQGLYLVGAEQADLTVPFSGVRVAVYAPLGSEVSAVNIALLDAFFGTGMDPLLIIHGSVYWIGPLDMWINHSGKTTYTTDYEGFRAYLLTVTTDILRFLAGSRASPGHRSAASTVFSEVCLYR